MPVICVLKPSVDISTGSPGDLSKTNPRIKSTISQAYAFCSAKKFELDLVRSAGLNAEKRKKKQQRNNKLEQNR